MRNGFKVCDTHCHLLRSTSQGWQARALDDRYDGGGTVEEFLRYMEEAGVDHAWGLALMPTVGMMRAAQERLPSNLSPAQRQAADEEIMSELQSRLERFNRWICGVGKEHPDQILPLINVEPRFGAEWCVAELENVVKEHGARGVKLHPGWQQFFPADERLWPFYEKAQELGVVVLSHSSQTGSLYSAEDDFAHPKNFEPILDTFPRLKLVLAHAGYVWQAHDTPAGQLKLAQKYENVYFDICDTFEEGFRGRDEEFIRGLGIDRVMWASDWHAHRGMLALEGFLRTTFNDEEKAKILGENALRLLPLRQVAKV